MAPVKQLLLLFQVAVKIIDLVKSQPYIVKNLWREATVLNQLDHPNIMRVFEAIVHDKRYFLVTELIEGGDLCGFVKKHKGKPILERVARRISRQIASALTYMHQRGIVHRDLKLENILMDSRKENIKLIDFGLSNVWKAECPLKTRCGSTEYSAPELFLPNTQYGPEVDLWAFGVILYTMAVGDFPFSYKTARSDASKRSHFFTMINNGLSAAHMCKITCYSKDFSTLLKGLLNPVRGKRLNIQDVMKNIWISNKKHWAPVEHEKINIYDLEKVCNKVCGQLSISKESLKAELSSKPFGEIAGYYKIALHEETKRQEESISSPQYIEFPTTGRCKIHQECAEAIKPNQICFVGSPQKINEVVARPRNPLRRGIYTYSTSSFMKNARLDINKTSINNVGTGDMGDCSSTPHKSSLKVKKVDSPAPRSPTNSNSGSFKSYFTKFKKTHSMSPDLILPNKMKIPSPNSKFGVK